MKICLLAAVLCASSVCWAQNPSPREPLTLGVGPLTLRPGGFFDIIGDSRSASTGDSISTRFGNIPLADTPAQSIVSMRNSRLLLRGDLLWRTLKFTGYMESDFLNVTPRQSDWRWRQYWGQAQYGKWEILGGQAWSMLRPNRHGTWSDKDLMHTDVIDAGYHAGLLGSRRRQLRLGRVMENSKVVFAWETQGNFLLKSTVDKPFGHAELTAFTGHRGRRGITAAAVVDLSSKIKFLTQEYWSKRAAFEALGVVPAGPNGLAAIQGIEVQATPNIRIHTYGGVVYASRSSGNRLVREWTVGMDRRFLVPSLWGSFLLSFEYSKTDRLVWTGRSGAMDYVMYRARYTFN